MQRSVSHEKLAICTVEVAKSETRLRSLDEIVDYLRACIEAEPLARSSPSSTLRAHALAAERRHRRGHPRRQEPGVLLRHHAAGPAGPGARPRSIGVCELDDRFVLTFAEAPMPVANLAMERWALSVVGREAA